MWIICFLQEWLCGTDCIDVYACMYLCSDVYSAVVCWRGVELCVLMFCVVIIYDVEYKILEIKHYSICLLC
jgi:hypothetical protein